ncbi:hypothetical protein [Crossiella cryophila]|uniref:Ferric siderophore reductase C-terminal domain-containing protein n=1 Tax=Crossiella cryophila TaxID=43355 RepID=A0A7W7C6N8_9PSEU|nr:hypothetical protein [Crossiella cryophila]MBB4675508.1 hypothetical protein [Crossiella cryophila]
MAAACPEIRIRCDPAPPEALSCARVAAEPEVALGLVAAEMAATAHRVEAAAARTAMSVYAIKIGQATVLPWALGLGWWHPDRVRLGGDGGHGWHTLHLPGAPSPVGLAELVEGIFEGHLFRVAGHLAAVRGCARPTMLGQIGFGIGTAFARAARGGADPARLSLAHQQLCATLPWLAPTGRLLPGPHGLTYLRNHCCLFWTAPDEAACRSCPRRTDEDRLST